MRLPIGRIALALSLALLPSRIHAQTQSRTWTMCSDDLFAACNSIMLTTAPELDSTGVRIGTFVGLAFQNLQGGSPLDQSNARTLSRFGIGGNYIGGPTDASDGYSFDGIFIGSGAGGGPAPGGREVLGFEVFAPGGWASLYDQLDFAGVQGCDADPTWDPDTNPGGIGRGRPAYTTCGSDAWISFEGAHVHSWIDADQMTDASLGWSGVDGSLSTDCATPSNRCMITTSVTPEPTTLLLAGTGFMVVLAAVRRRKDRGVIDEA